MQIYVRKITTAARRHAGLHTNTPFVFSRCCQRLCLVFSFKLSLSPHAGRSSASVHAVYTVQTNFILWLPSSAALRIARSRNQQSSVARLRSIHKYCLFPANPPIIFVVELIQHIRPVNAARRRWRCHAQPHFQDRGPVHTNTTVNHRVLSHLRKMIHLLWLRSLLPLCPIFKRSLFFLSRCDC